VNAASGWVSQIARSSAVIVNQPNVYMYRPGSITRPTCAQVTLFMGKSLSLCLQSPISTSLEFFGTPRRSLPEAFFGFFLKLATLRSGLLSSWASSFFIIASRDFLLGHRDDQYKREDQHRPLVGFIGGHCHLPCLVGQFSALSPARVSTGMFTGPPTWVRRAAALPRRRFQMLVWELASAFRSGPLPAPTEESLAG
jgi:hypothetical protein